MTTLQSHLSHCCLVLGMSVQSSRLSRLLRKSSRRQGRLIQEIPPMWSLLHHDVLCVLARHHLLLFDMV
jgi:hypothetical protein